MSEERLPAAGMAVFSNDGAHLGHVAETNAASGWFKVNTPQAPDFWLPLEDVQDNGPRYVLLKTRRTQVRARKWEGAEPELPSLSTAGTNRRAADSGQGEAPANGS